MSSISEPNFTQIPNVVFDYWMQKLKPSSFLVLLFLCRKTFGWHVTSSGISLRRLCDCTSLSKPTVIEAISELEACKLILVSRAMSPNGGAAINKYTLNVHKPVDDISSGLDYPDDDNEPSPGGGNASLPGVGKNSDHFKRNDTSYLKTKNDNPPKPPLPEAPSAQTSQQSSFFSSKDGLSFFSSAENVIPKFCPKTYRLQNGQNLSLRMQRALAKYKPSQQEKIIRNVMFYENHCRSGKHIKDHERFLQYCITRDLAGIENNIAQNDLYARFVQQEHKSLTIEILQTVIHFVEKIGKSMESISKSLPHETFAGIIDAFVARNEKFASTTPA